MTDPYILIFYTERDPCGRAVTARLRAQATIPVVAIDLESEHDLAFEFTRTGAFKLIHNGRDHGVPSACWSRNKMRSPPRTLTEEDVHQQLRAGEWRGLVNGVTQLFGDRKVNGQHACSNKVYQYQAATAAGFLTPAGSFFLGKARGADFLARHPSSVLKAIGYPNIPEPNLQTAGTTLVTTTVEQVVFDAAAEVRFSQSPTWFQERLASGSEYRVIVVGDEVVAHRMIGRIEHRRFADGRMLSPKFERCALEPETLDSIARFRKVTGLDYGVFDFIQSEGELFYLECNPEGQWHSAKQTGDFDFVADRVADLIFQRAAHFGAPEIKVVAADAMALA